MKLQDQVCTLDQAKKLVEFGVGCNSHFCYWNNKLTETEKAKSSYKKHNMEMIKCFPAYTVAELGVLLIYCINDVNIYIDKTADGEYWKQVELFNGPKLGKLFKTEAQARAEALIWLLENKYLNVEDIRL